MDQYISGDDEIVLNGKRYILKSAIGVDGMSLVDMANTLKSIRWIEQEIDYQINAAKEFHAALQEEGLNIGAVEAEGFLRGLKYAKNLFGGEFEECLKKCSGDEE